MTAVIICDRVISQDRPQVYLHVIAVAIKPSGATLKAERRIRTKLKHLSVTCSVLITIIKVLLTDCCFVSYRLSTTN